MNNFQIDSSLLPGVLREMVEQIGLNATMEIVKAYGGIRLYIPKTDMCDDHALVKLIGREAAEKLQEMYAGENHFDIPLAMAALRAIRNSKIIQESEYKSVSQLAREHRTTERNIRMITNSVVDDRQAGLF